MILINFLIILLIFVLVALVVRWVMGQLGVPANIQTVVLAILGLIALLWLLQGVYIPALRLR